MKMKKEMKALKSELAEMFDIDIDSWGFIRDIQYKIKQLKIMANETERKKAIAEELEKLKSSLGCSIYRITRE